MVCRCGHEFFSKKKYEKNEYLICPKCGIQDIRDNFGPSDEDILRCSVIIDCLERAIQSKKENELDSVSLFDGIASRHIQELGRP
jgi:hypothetical protein